MEILSVKTGNKKGAVGDSIIMIYRLVLVTFIALIVLGISAIAYDYYIDVKKLEVGIMNRQVMDCLAPAGVLDLDRFPKEQENNIFEYCRINNTERFYSEAVIFDEQDNPVKTLTGGDSGLAVFAEAGGASKESMKKYDFAEEISQPRVNIIYLNKRYAGMAQFRTIIKHEF